MKLLSLFLLLPALSYAQTNLTSVKNRLLEIRVEDQQCREAYIPIAEKYGYESPQAKTFWKEAALKDSLHMQEVRTILNRYGWLSRKQIGKEANQTLFLVIQHSNLPNMKHYLPIMRKAVRERKAESFDLALLEDRVAFESGGEQIYGTQIGMDTLTKEWYVEPLIEPERVDERRKSVGLPPLDVYTKAYGFNWNVEEHKKRKALLKQTEQ
ncbi:DUF6624 domain-containing protein [Siphonobacter sp. SORGH_AS_1065]|uniref:DUF6624 domain-containing protein n=1 Tax=Siphonobacter sp. SORGH_AS_1065 TaxID=3041795 RepID=UPI002786AD45|nr:DUF6624 domain-containing protein [Siphonobacter sp. SORGH_AS_1065]MDQ1089965.1 hypothetical protein [Siphonobacter sp. SORGH_AS_1065]